MNELAYGTIFEKGIPNPYGEFFSGKSYLAMLTQLNGVGVANVTFEPACRNNWHIHHGEKGGGQIFCLLQEDVAGIRNGVRTRRSFKQVM